MRHAQCAIERSSRARAPRLARRTRRRGRRVGHLDQVRTRRTRPSASPSALTSQSIRPSNGTRCSSFLPSLSWTCVVIRCSGDRLDGVGRRPSGTRGRSRGRCRSAAVEVAARASSTSEAASTARSGSLRARPARRAARLAAISSTLRNAAVRLFSPPAAGVPQVHDEHLGRDPPRDVQRGVRLTHRRLAPLLRADGVRDRLPHCSRRQLGDRRVHAVKREPVSFSHSPSAAIAAGSW